MLAWTLVRDDFPGKSLVNSLIDLPFALPTIVAGLTLLALYGPTGGIGVNIAYTRAGVLMALLFVTLPFVVRTVQPVLLELDREMEEAAASLGAGRFTIFRRIVFPNFFPALLSGVALAFARAIGEFGAVVLIAGQHPVQDRGRVGLRLPARLQRRHDGRRRARRCCCSRSRSPSCSRSAPSGAGPPAMIGKYLVRFSALGYLAVILVAPVGLIFWRAFEHGLGAVLGRDLEPERRARAEAHA